MPELPGGGFTLLFACGVGLALVVILAVKGFRFSFHFRRGIESFNEKNYQAALRHLIQAERLWMLRTTKQTRLTRSQDYKKLGIVLDLINQAARHLSFKIDTGEYREAVSEMERFVSNDKKSYRDYPKIYSTFAALRKQFRVNVRNICL